MTRICLPGTLLRIRIPFCSLASLLCATAFPQLYAQERVVDFRYSPQHYFSAICFPDDWQKTVATERGGLGYDFGPGPYAVPRTEIWVGTGNGDLASVRQFLEDPRVPVVTTVRAKDGATLTLHAFALAPPTARYVSPLIAGGRITRHEGFTGCVDWASPPEGSSPAFRSVAWGVNRPVKYNVAVEPHAAKLIALGVCESYKWGPRTRLLELHVEGAAPLQIDPMREGRKNIPYVFLLHGADLNGDGRLEIEVDASPASPDANPILNAFWLFPDSAAVTPDQIIRGATSVRPELSYNCGPENELYGGNVRTDILEGEVRGSGVAPVLYIRSPRELRYDSTTATFMAGGRMLIRTRPRPLRITQHGDSVALVFPPKTRRLEIAVSHGGPVPPRFDLRVAVSQARRYWKNEKTIPKGKIDVPDSGIQYLLDANVRNLYQIRERVDRKLQFQPGPSVYRGLWLHDAVWHITAALMLGDTASARAEIDGLLSYQLPDGQVEIMTPWVMIRETPLLIYILCRFAEMTNDSAWIAAQWDRINRGLDWVERQRSSMMADSNSVTYGLMPPSFADGGLGGTTVEYSSVYWTLIGIRKAIETARWLGRTADALRWKALFDELMASFRAASNRDMKKDPEGNLYLPMKVADTSVSTPPQQAQWAILEAQYLGGLLDRRDPLIVGTLHMLNAGSSEGLALNAGWLKGGVWPFFSAIQGMAELWEANADRAAELLYACANHASPLGTWVEEQLPRNVGSKTSGDGSNASASALFIMLVRDIIAMERDSSLDLLAGVPARWYRPGGHIRLNNVPTKFGNLTLHVSISQDGRSGQIDVSPPHGSGRPGGPTVFLESLRRMGYRARDGSPLPARLQGAWGKRMSIRFERE